MSLNHHNLLYELPGRGVEADDVHHGVELLAVLLHDGLPPELIVSPLMSLCHTQSHLLTTLHLFLPLV